MEPTQVSAVRRVVVRLIIGSFAFAALLGILALLVPGRVGSVQGRILLTTLVVGVTSVLALCYLAIGDSRSRWVGLAGGVAALVSAGCALDIVWAHWQHDPGPGLLRTFGVSGIVALTLAQFALLLAVVPRRHDLTGLVRSTVAAGTVLAALLVAVVLGWDPGDGALRVIGVVAILDVLGTVVTIALAVFGSDRRRRTAPLTVVVPEALAVRLRARAEAAGQDPTELVLDAVTRYVESADV